MLSAFVLVACSGTDDGNGGGGGGGGGSIGTDKQSSLNAPEEVFFSQVNVGGKTTGSALIKN
ncbi:MAG: glycoside hydrolase family 5 protein, partial [Bradymonadaceae bacterium]